MVGSIIKNSCLLVYTHDRIGRPNKSCYGDAASGGWGDTGKFKNNRKFENNGCSKVDRVPNTCSVTLMRG